MPSLVAWIAVRDAQERYLKSVSKAELLYGVEILPEGRRRSALAAGRNRCLARGFDNRILPFDSAAASVYEGIAADRRQAGRPTGQPDCQIAAIPRSSGAVLVTRNFRDFRGRGIDVVNPRGHGITSENWHSGAPDVIPAQDEQVRGATALPDPLSLERRVGIQGV